MAFLMKLLLVVFSLGLIAASEFLTAPGTGLPQTLQEFAGPVGLPILLLGSYAIAGLWIAGGEAGPERLTRLHHAKMMGWGSFALGLIGTYLAVISLSSTGALETSAIVRAMGSSLMGLTVFFTVMILADFMAPGHERGD